MTQSSFPHGQTHLVTNQPPLFHGYNLYTQDPALIAAVEREGGSWADETLRQIGAFVGSDEAQEWARTANEHPPLLKTHDRYGNRLDEVEFHPSYHHLMRFSITHGTHHSSWSAGRAGSHVARAASFYLISQMEQGHCCPISMTHAAVPLLQKYASVPQSWLENLFSTEYDQRLLPLAEKQGLLCGMGMTEKQGGSDPRSNSTSARSLGSQAYLLTGHKWFFSAPMSDLFLVLAQTPGGLSCFLVPRFQPDGSKNHLYFQRLKSKLGNRSNASSEVEFQEAWSLLLGEEGAGVRTIIEMVNATRLDCMLGSAALMRQAVSLAIHHTSYRSAFGKHLIEQPLMRNVLSDLALEVEAAMTLSLRMARASDEAEQNEQARLFKRLGVALGKFWITKRAPALVAEALECLGGNGYVEEQPLGRLYREAPLNSIWEGAGNVNALDVLRALGKESSLLECYFAEIQPAVETSSLLKQAVTRLQRELRHTEEMEWRARHLVEQMTLLLQASLLIQHAPEAISDAFCQSRLGEQASHIFGTLPLGVQANTILQRSWPSLP